MERLHKSPRPSGSKSTTRDFSNICLSVSRLIDLAVAKNQRNPILQDLPQLLKKVWERKEDAKYQPAIMVLMMSVKNAIHLGWFTATEAQEIRQVSNELLGYFTGNEGQGVADTADTSQFISNTIISRFYPRLKLQAVIHAVEAKPGYEAMVRDFYVPKKPSLAEQLRLFVIRRDNTDTSACLVTPPHVNFLVNGKGVERRTIVFMDSGPQMPTDVTGLLKIGTNLLQVVGDFPAPYTIVLAITGTVFDVGSTLNMQHYCLTTVKSRSAADDELIEGPSRISLRCPISHKRIVTPVKGSLCKHHQCFDYESFMEINCRRPAWRCPYCNRHISFPDLRLDQQMMKVLKEVQDIVVDVMISEDGSWEAVQPKDDTNNKILGTSRLDKRDTSSVLDKAVRDQSPEEGEIVPEQDGLTLIDLSNEDEIESGTGRENNRGVNYMVVGRPTGRSDVLYREAEDVKPNVRDINITSIPELLPTVGINSAGSSSTLASENIGTNSTASEPVSSSSSLALNLAESFAPLEGLGILEAARDWNFSTSSAMDFLGTSLSPRNNDFLMLPPLQTITPDGTGVSAAISSEGFSERLLTREVSRTPIAIQALPAQIHLSNPNSRPRFSANSHPNSPAQPSGPHTSIATSSSYIGNQRTSHIPLPNMAMDIGLCSFQEAQPQFFQTGYQQSHQDTQSTPELQQFVQMQLQSNVQAPFSENLEMHERQHRPNQQSQALRTTQPLMQSGQRLPTEQQHVSAGRGANQSRPEHQGLRHQQASYQQLPHQQIHNINDVQQWQQIRLSALQLQQVQQAYINLGASQDHFNQGHGGGLLAGIVEGLPVMNQSPSASASAVGAGRRQSLPNIRSAPSQNLQRSSNSLIIPNTSASSVYSGDQRWASSSVSASGQLVDGAAALLAEQSRRPVARMRGSITTTGRIPSFNSPTSSCQGPPGNYAWHYGVSSQPAAMASPGTSNPSSRLSPGLPVPWISEQARPLGGSSNLHNNGVSTGLGTGLQSSQIPYTSGWDLNNWFDTQLENSLPNRSQVPGSMAGIGSNPFIFGGMDAF